ncbi:MAG: DUF2231 domain-containing protein, partial [Trebonia sp.]
MIKIAGHPEHPMLIAFPVVCYTGTLVGFAVYAANGHLFWLNLAIALSVAGAGSVLLAALPGLGDWRSASPRDSAAKLTGLLHAGLNVTALGLFAAGHGRLRDQLERTRGRRHPGRRAVGDRGGGHD